jgi:uncharacterized radical SAM superfamily Fe-S cluster-containing enzyme
MDNGELINETQSICPYCLKKITANKVKYGDKIYMEKSCSEHGKFKTLIWDGEPSMESWKNDKIPAFPREPFTKVDKGCPFDCGLCADHRQHTCTALIEVTKRCNLKCKFCFASSGDQNESFDIELENIKFMYNSVLKSAGTCNIQLSGGEPTMREDLPDIIRLGHNLGFEFIQVNTNGIRIASDMKYVKKLKEAGLDSIFLQFDGTNDVIYKKLRGVELLNLKIKAIDNCKKNNIGVVLVPTLVPDVNLDDIGNIIDFGLENIPAVRGVHFQPVSYFGRFSEVPQNERITIPEVLRYIEKQTDGRIKKECFKPPGCENAFCSFHGNFLYKGKGNLMAITSNKSSCCEKPKRAEIGAVKAKSFTARSWSGVKMKGNAVKLSEGKVTTWDDIIYNIKNSSFSISGMAFQDAWNFDIERVKDCCIHEVSPDGKLIPFCAYNLTDNSGKYIYRGKV